MCDVRLHCDRQPDRCSSVTRRGKLVKRCSYCGYPNPVGRDVCFNCNADLAAPPPPKLLPRRPIGVTVIACILVVAPFGGALLVLAAIAVPEAGTEATRSLHAMGVSVPALLLQSAVGGLVCIVCGIGLLGGRNWARVTYLVWCGVSMVLSCVQYGLKPDYALSLIFYAVIAYFLLREDASDYFSGRA